MFFSFVVNSFSEICKHAKQLCFLFRVILHQKLCANFVKPSQFSSMIFHQNLSYFIPGNFTKKQTSKHILIKGFFTEPKLVLEILRLQGAFNFQKSSQWLFAALTFKQMEGKNLKECDKYILTFTDPVPYKRLV